MDTEVEVATSSSSIPSNSVVTVNDNNSINNTILPVQPSMIPPSSLPTPPMNALFVPQQGIPTPSSTLPNRNLSQPTTNNDPNSISFV